MAWRLRHIDLDSCVRNVVEQDWVLTNDEMSQEARLFAGVTARWVPEFTRHAA